MHHNKTFWHLTRLSKYISPTKQPSTTGRKINKKIGIFFIFYQKWGFPDPLKTKRLWNKICLKTWFKNVNKLPLDPDSQVGIGCVYRWRNLECVYSYFSWKLYENFWHIYWLIWILKIKFNQRISSNHPLYKLKSHWNSFH